jgi:adenosylcobinamide-phosphate synthase
VEKPAIGDPTRPVDAEDITKTVKLMYAASTAALVIFAAVRLAVVLAMGII